MEVRNIQTLYAYFHEKLVQTKSLSRTIRVINSLPPQYHAYRKSSSYEALAVAVHLSSRNRPSGSRFSSSDDEELADRYRLAIAGLLLRSWGKRRKLTTEIVQDLDCYTESAPVLGKDGIFDLSPVSCDTQECSLADELRSSPKLLTKMADAIPTGSTRREDVQRRQVLRDLVRTKHYQLTPERCRALGDAVFAFFAPADSNVLTTNKKDLGPLAEALGKTVLGP